jgi:hypothetical protein
VIQGDVAGGGVSLGGVDTRSLETDVAGGVSLGGVDTRSLETDVAGGAYWGATYTIGVRASNAKLDFRDASRGSGRVPDA